MEIIVGSKNKTKYNILHSNKEIDINDNEKLFEYFKQLIRLRHDLLHFIVLEMLGREWSSEKSVRMYFELYDDENPNLDKTPDIIHNIGNNEYIMIDVSVSKDIHTSSKQKQDKYEPICQYLLRSKNIQILFYHINVQSSFANVEPELEKIQKYQKFPPDLHFLNECLMLLEEKKQFVSDHISKEFFEKKKIESYTTDEIMFEKLGSYQDIDIEINEFLKFNGSFSFEENAIETIKKFDENQFCETMKEILETKNNVYMKYCDNKCDTYQFDSAKNTILQKNENLKKKLPKPTHHVMIPFKENEQINMSESEQEQNIDFFDKILKSNFVTTDNKLIFLQEFAQKHNELFRNKESLLNKKSKIILGM